LAAEGLLAPAAVIAAVAAVAAAAAAATPASCAGSGTGAAAVAPIVARAPCPLPVLSRPAVGGRRLAVGHLLHEVEGRLCVQMFVWVDQVHRPPRADGLRHLLMAVATPAHQLQAVHHDSRRHRLPELNLELSQITQN
jgi:hypothetical protein